MTSNLNTRSEQNSAPEQQSQVSSKDKAQRVDMHPNLNAKLLKPTGYVMHHQFNIQQLYALPTLYLCVLYLSENKQRLVPLAA